MYNPEPVQHRPDQPAATTTPLREYLNHTQTGVDQRYVVLPRALLETMPLVWQQHMAQLLGEFHRTHAHLKWPVYRVVPSRWEKIVDLDEEQLTEAGIVAEIDADGELVYRDRNGARINDAETRTVLVSTFDSTLKLTQERNIPPRGFSQPPGANSPPPSPQRPAGNMPPPQGNPKPPPNMAMRPQNQPR